MTARVTTIGILIKQLYGSKGLLSLLFVTFSISLIIKILGLATSLIDYLIFSSLYFIMFFIGIALITAVHESGHLSQAKKLGIKLKSLVVNRIGNVSFSVDTNDDIQPEKQYAVAVAPYLQKKQYISELFILICLLATAILSPYPLNVLLFVISIFPILHFGAVLSTFYVIKTAKTSGFLIKFSEKLASLGDMEHIKFYNSRVKGEHG